MIELGSRKPLFRRKRRSNPYVIVLLIGLIMVGVYFLLSIQRGEIKPLFEPTPTATRMPVSYMLEAETQFKAGNFAAAIAAYGEASKADPNDAKLMADLARLQTYYSNLANTVDEKKQRLGDAMKNVDQANLLKPDDPYILAIRALVYDWNSYSEYAGEFSAQYLNEADRTAQRAIQLDANNALAYAFLAEINIDDGYKMDQAQVNIQRALELGPDLMDVRRVAGVVLEANGDYAQAIEAYKKALEITPNFTPLYVRIGINYRALARRMPIASDEFNATFATAASYYEKAVIINTQLGIVDAVPYIGLANTYAESGDFFASVLNMRKVLNLLPDNSDVYAQLGLVYHKSRNYEGSIEAFKCAIEGCSSVESAIVRQVNLESAGDHPISPVTLSDSTAQYYYTYASVLAGMHRPGSCLCERALPVMDLLRQRYPEDNMIMNIIRQNEDICVRYPVEQKCYTTGASVPGYSTATPNLTETQSMEMTLGWTATPTITPITPTRSPLPTSTPWPTLTKAPTLTPTPVRPTATRAPTATQ